MKTARSILLEFALTLFIKKRSEQGYNRRTVEAVIALAVQRRCNRYYTQKEGE